MQSILSSVPTHQVAMGIPGERERDSAMKSNANPG
jgi:hypothetical protein